MVLTALPPDRFRHQLRSSLPDTPGIARSLVGSESSQQIIDLAYQIQRHAFPILGLIIDTGPDIRWRRGYLAGSETGGAYLSRIPFLKAPRAGDHKVIWETNRHQHLIVLAQAYLLAGDTGYLDKIRAQLESWNNRNPFQRDTNRASVLEVTFRALSRIWGCHLAGPEFPLAFLARWFHMLYLHGCHPANKLSFYFSATNRLVREALGAELGILDKLERHGHLLGGLAKSIAHGCSDVLARCVDFGLGDPIGFARSPAVIASQGLGR
jgi:hypothetical protein